MGLLGAALIYGDGAITPAISVLSALEGVNVVTDAFKPFVMPIAVVILFVLFAAQRFGTEKIGRAFGPVMLLWFVVIALLGIAAIVRHPAVIAARRSALRGALHVAIGPLRLPGVGRRVPVHHRRRGAVCRHGAFRQGSDPAFLVLRRAARAAAELCRTNRVLDGKGNGHGQSLFSARPAWSIYPLVVLATMATIIASQAIITASFSMTRQAMQLGWLPGVTIRQTSDRSLRPDLRAGGQLAVDGGDRRDHHRLRHLGPAGGRLRHGRVDHHAADHLSAVPRHARSVELAAAAAVAGGGHFHRGRYRASSPPIS